MSINFGYGMGMNPMGMNMMGNGIQGNNSMQSFGSQYNCPACYQSGPVPYALKTNVNPLPQYAVNQTWLSRIVRKFFGV